jgi:hypothetical protein
MILTFCIFLSAIFSVFLTRHSKAKIGLFVSFLLLYIFQAIRYDFGNDYLAYLKSYDLIKSSPLELNSLLNYSKDYRLEIGYVLLIKFFPFTSFFAFVAIWSLVNCLVYYSIIKKYVHKSYYWFALAIYLFCPLGMLIQLSAFRQTIAIWIFVWAFKFLRDQKPIKFLILMTLGGLFHSSCFILIPLYLMGKKQLLTNKLIYVFSMIFVLLVFLNTPFRNYLLPLIENNFNRYSVYTTSYMDSLLRNQSKVEIIMKTFLLVLILITYKNGNLLQRQYSILASFFIFLSCFVNIFVMSDRLSMYFIPFLIIAVPNSMVYIKKQLVQNLSMLLVISYYLLQFFRTFYSDTWGSHYINYNSVFKI